MSNDATNESEKI